MKPQIAVASISLLASCVALGACADEEPASVADPVQLYGELTDREARSNYSVTYDLDDQHDLQRVRGSDILRWNDAYADDDGLAGVSAIREGADWHSCRWATTRALLEIEVSCGVGDPRWERDLGRLLTMSDEEIASGTFSMYADEIADIGVTCFQMSNLFVQGTVCLSGDGVPLRMLVEDAVGNRSYTAEAIDIEGVVDGTEAGRQIVETTSRDFDVRAFSPGDVRLPDLPKTRELVLDRE